MITFESKNPSLSTAQLTALREKVLAGYEKMEARGIQFAVYTCSCCSHENKQKIPPKDVGEWGGVKLCIYCGHTAWVDCKSDGTIKVTEI